MKKDTSSKSTSAISFLFLLLTATAPMTDDDLARVTNDGFANVDAFTSTPYLMYAASLLSNVKGAVDGSWKIRTELLEEEEDEEEDSTQGKTDTDEVLSTAATESNGTVSDLLQGALPFLDLRDIAAVRVVSRAWEIASRSVARFSPERSALFLPWDASAPKVVPSFLKGLRPRDAQEVLRRTLQWQCAHCSFWNATGRNMCANQKCFQPRFSEGVTEAVDPAAHRLFVGQLRKEHTSELLGWLLGMTLPGLEVVHIESHTNPSQGGRGKGCAWLYLRNTADVQRLMSLHRRVYVDVDESGQEGVWMCGPTEDDKDLLTHYAGQRACAKDRPQVLPRNCLVIEEPSKAGGVRTAPSRPSYNTSASQNYYVAPSRSYLPPPPPVPRRPMHHQGCPCNNCRGTYSYPQAMQTTPYGGYYGGPAGDGGYYDHASQYYYGAPCPCEACAQMNAGSVYA